jgi:hypothetical protein
MSSSGESPIETVQGEVSYIEPIELNNKPEEKQDINLPNSITSVKKPSFIGNLFGQSNKSGDMLSMVLSNKGKYKFLISSRVEEKINELKKDIDEFRKSLSEEIQKPSTLIKPAEVQNDSILSIIKEFNTSKDQKATSLKQFVEKYLLDNTLSNQITGNSVTIEVPSEVNETTQEINSSIESRIMNTMNEKINGIKKNIITTIDDYYKQLHLEIPRSKFEFSQSNEYYKNRISISKVFIQDDLNRKKYLKPQQDSNKPNLTDKQLDVLLSLSGQEYNQLFSKNPLPEKIQLKNGVPNPSEPYFVDLIVPPGEIFLGVSTVETINKFKQPGKFIGNVITKTKSLEDQLCFMDVNGVIYSKSSIHTTNLNRNIWKIYVVNNFPKLIRSGINGGRKTIKKQYKSSRFTKNNRSKQRKTQKSTY